MWSTIFKIHPLMAFTKRSGTPLLKVINIDIRYAAKAGLEKPSHATSGSSPYVLYSERIPLLCLDQNPCGKWRLLINWFMQMRDQHVHAVESCTIPHVHQVLSAQNHPFAGVIRLRWILRDQRRHVDDAKQAEAYNFALLLTFLTHIVEGNADFSVREFFLFVSPWYLVTGLQPLYE